MTTLAEHAAQWTDNRGHDVYPRFPARLPYKLREFFKKRGCARFGWGEITNRWGFAIDFTKMGAWYLYLQLGWPCFFINLPTKGRKHGEDYDVNKEQRSYGVSIFDRQIALHFGFWRKYLPAPWATHVVANHFLMWNGQWCEEIKMPVTIADIEERHAEYEKLRAAKEACEFVQVEDFWHNPPGMETQRGKARITVGRYFSRPVWRAWLPLFTKQTWTFWCDFSCEVGSRAGSWKGGTTGCGGEIKRGESIGVAFQRMMNTPGQFR